MQTIPSLSKSRGFTLIELLTVIAIIGILAAIIIPTTGAVRTAAKKAQVKSMFSQWTTAFSLYKQEYGFYPNIGTDGTDNLLSTKNDTLEFVRAFTAKELNGTDTTATNLNGNKRRQSFYSFSDAELPSATELLTDAFGNTQFGVIWDANGDGVIKVSGAGKDGDIQGVAGVDGGTFTPTTGASATDDIPTDGVKAGVIFFSAGKSGATTISNKDAVMSWK